MVAEQLGVVGGAALRTVAEIIENDEDFAVEFKSTARWDLREDKPNKAMEDAIVKTVAGFLNTDGGTLLIGVGPDREVVGLDHDYPRVKPSNGDGFVNWLTTHLTNALGHAAVMRTRERGSHAQRGRDLPPRRRPPTSPVWAKTSKEDRVLRADEQLDTPTAGRTTPGRSMVHEVERAAVALLEPSRQRRRPRRSRAGLPPKTRNCRARRTWSNENGTRVRRCRDTRKAAPATRSCLRHQQLGALSHSDRRSGQSNTQTRAYWMSFARIRSSRRSPAWGSTFPSSCRSISVTTSRAPVRGAPQVLRWLIICVMT